MACRSTHTSTAACKTWGYWITQLDHAVSIQALAQEVAEVAPVARHVDLRRVEGEARSNLCCRELLGAASACATAAGAGDALAAGAGGVTPAWPEPSKSAKSDASESDILPQQMLQNCIDKAFWGGPFKRLSYFLHGVLGPWYQDLKTGIRLMFCVRS